MVTTASSLLPTSSPPAVLSPNPGGRPSTPPLLPPPSTLPPLLHPNRLQWRTACCRRLEMWPCRRTGVLRCRRTGVLQCRRMEVWLCHPVNFPLELLSRQPRTRIITGQPFFISTEAVILKGLLSVLHWLVAFFYKFVAFLDWLVLI